MVDSLYQHYVGHCSLCGVYFVYVTLQDLASHCLQVTGFLYTDQFILMFYFKISSDSWD